jgi:hypothetical protein
MWPFSEMSLSGATVLGTIANWILLASLLAGVLSTFIIVKASDVKEEHWAEDRRQSNERIATLNNDTERLKADNLALQTVMLPRHVGLIGLDEKPPAIKWFAGMEAFAGTEISIQFSSEPEARNLANEIAIVLTKFGWKARATDENTSHLSSTWLMDGVRVLYPVGKPWTELEPNQPWLKWHDAAEALARALTNAGLGVGNSSVSVGGFTNEPPQVPGTMAYFDPPLTSKRGPPALPGWQ